MTRAIDRVVIVGGGTAGWLAACRIAATGVASVTLVEAPDIPTIGVGEGSWPTLRATLAACGIAEGAFLRGCDASFKQGSRFDGWVDGSPGDSYLHPFTAPPAAAPRDLVAAWQAGAPQAAYADAVTAQAQACALGLAPRQRAMPDYAGALNYGYHLDAGKLAALLTRHATAQLGVRHLRDHVEAVEAAPDGDIAAVRTRGSGSVAGDLFLDCTGHAGLLIGGHFGVPWVDREDVLFNDRALAVQLPVASDSPIAAQTVATAHDAGWIWDIGLPTRRGIGCVYASRFMADDDAAAVLADYVARALPDAAIDPSAFRRLAFRSGHRARFWERNCLAVGLSAGFLEPLEASAIVTIELSLDALVDNFPASRAAMDVHARRFNTLFAYRWDRIVEFLKLHYVLSRRTGAYWDAHRDSATWPDRLADLLLLWREQPPSPYDFPMADEIFAAASHQYVLYGMGFAPPASRPTPGSDAAARALAQVAQRGRSLVAGLPTNRAYLDALRSETAAPAGAGALGS